jgi:hypothetical protein
VPAQDSTFFENVDDNKGNGAIINVKPMNLKPDDLFVYSDSDSLPYTGIPGILIAVA